MRMYFVGVVLVPVLAALALAADRSQLYSTPSLPPREALDRLNLQQVWYTYVPMDGRRDGFLSVQIEGKQLLFQTRSGLVGAIDSETGRVLWRTLPGRSYETSVPLAFNTFSIYVLNATDLYALDRRTGQMQWQHRLPGGLSAAPVADDEQIYLCGSNTRVYAMRVPKYDLTGRFISGELEARILGGTIGSAETRAFVTSDYTIKSEQAIPDVYRNSRPQTGPRPRLVWEVQTNQLLEHRPILSKEVLLVSGNVSANRAGRIMGFTKFPYADTPKEVFRFPLNNFLTVAPGAYENTAYVGGAEANLFAVNMDSGRIEWRFITGEPVVRAPVATAKDVFVSTERNGMARVDRDTGAPGWRVPAGNQTLEYNNEADRYLASNPKFVYAQDRAGRLLVLDRLQGKTLSRYDLLDYVYPVVNEQTDRLFLAANNGMILCLRDKEYIEPYQHRQSFSEAEMLLNGLSKLVTQKAVENVPLKTYLKEFEKTHKLKMLISERAYQDESKLDVLLKPISLPALTNRPLKDILQMVLDQVDSTSITVRDTILIAPRVGAKPPVPMPMPAPVPIP